MNQSTLRIRKCCRCRIDASCQNCLCARENRGCVDCLPAVNCRNVTIIEHQNMINVENINNEEGWLWGTISGAEAKETISKIYDDIVHWKKNIFMPPSGAATKKYIKESTRLIMEWVNDTPCSPVAMKALFIMPQLLLQKPFATSKCKDHSEALERRLHLWHEGKFEEIFNEGRTIQQRLKIRKKSKTEINEISQRFKSLIQKGKVNAAIRMLDEKYKGDQLPINDATIELLRQKHPSSNPINEDALLEGPIEKIDPIIFQEIDARLIRKMAIHMDGSAGPSGLDSDGWKKLLTYRGFGSYSSDLCKAIAEMAKKLCTKTFTEEHFDKQSIETFLSCRLIPIDKSPGVRPIGIGEILRRLIGKTVMSILKQDVMNTAGSLQLCAGQRAGSEAAIHGMRNIFNEFECNAVLLVDASNAFNSLNRQCMLHNVKILCPTIARYISNCYAIPARMFISGGGELTSNEGTTQGDPISMATYAIGIHPMLEQLRSSVN